MGSTYSANANGEACGTVNIKTCVAGEGLTPATISADSACRPCTTGSTFSASGNAPCKTCAADATCTAGVKTACTKTTDTVCNVSSAHPIINTGVLVKWCCLDAEFRLHVCHTNAMPPLLPPTIASQPPPTQAPTAPSPSAVSPGGRDGVVGPPSPKATAEPLLPAWCWEDFLVELQPQTTSATDGGSSIGVLGVDQRSELSARVNAPMYGKNYGNARAFAPLDGLFLAVAGGGESAIVVLSSEPACIIAVNAAVSVTVGGLVAPVYNRSQDGLRITVTLPPYKTVCPSLGRDTMSTAEQCGLGGGMHSITVKGSGAALREEEVLWSCPPSCPSGQPTTTNRSMLHPSNTDELRAAVGGITYVQRCTRKQQNNNVTSRSPVPPVSYSTSSNQCAMAMKGLIPFVTDPRSCLDPARAQSAPCAYGESGECKCCPANARCPGGARTWPARGYWVSSENSTEVNRCDPPQMERCMGMVHGSSIGSQCGTG